MIGHLAYAAGSPCPTIVLDGARLPADQDELLAYLAAARGYLFAAGGGHVLKFALVQPSVHPMFDLDYRFVQALPGAVDRFDLRGSCGHSILSAVLAAERMGMVGRLTADGRIRVHVRNNGDHVVCEVDRITRDSAEFTVHFVRPEPVPVTALLLTGSPRTLLGSGGAKAEVSLVSAGNPYAFVDARSLGFADPATLFGHNPQLFARMTGIRAAAADHLRWPRAGAFPKIAAILPAGPGRIAARAVTVPGWHPTIALTGAVCLASALRVPGTVTEQIAQAAGAVGRPIEIVTPNGRTTVTTALAEVGGEAALAYASVTGKRVEFQGSFVLEPLARLQFEEVSRCLASSVTPV
ncbi:PrpF domain-containing protein [Micromonospora sp. NPDC048830]|uniref:PrpF domain-containing protein n=1 Tax=Micromonospora sp. NPDC048830 TaxID=3364257 RepID=UPI003721BBD5